ncbi:hypothetical protein KKJ04_23630, partial [Xenorhabdus bovienii]|uniref:hypothetical protein n=1 Tax=Xenorhabdus bovienii TaxID=40576 RepID=UPI0023B2A2D9
GSSASSGYIVGDNVKYHSSSEVVKVFSSGDIIFPAEHFTTSKGLTIVTATVTDPDTEAIYVYEYRFNPQRYVFSPEVGNDGLVKLGENSGNSICESLDS